MCLIQMLQAVSGKTWHLLLIVPMLLVQQIFIRKNPTCWFAVISWNMSEYVKNLLILVASKSHKSNQPNKVGVQNIGTNSSLIVTYSHQSVVYLLRESDRYERIILKFHYWECSKRAYNNPISMHAWYSNMRNTSLTHPDPILPVHYL